MPEDVGELPNPVYTADPLEVAAAELPVAEDVAAMVLIVDVLTRIGSCAPQGWSVRQDDTQAEFVPQLSAH